jgi:hypothetical protein
MRATRATRIAPEGLFRLSAASDAELPLDFEFSAAGWTLLHGKILAAVRAEMCVPSLGELAGAVPATRSVKVRRNAYWGGSGPDFRWGSDRGTGATRRNVRDGRQRWRCH